MARHDSRADEKAMERDNRQMLLSLKAPPLTLLDDPLEYVLIDNFRHRLACSALCRCAEMGRISGEDAAALASFFTHDLALHQADEEKELFPALLRRALPEDGMETILARLEEEGRSCGGMLQEIAATLSCHNDNTVAISAERSEFFCSYAAKARRHVATENSIIMPIARIRLKRNDLAVISRAMKERRGIAD